LLLIFQKNELIKYAPVDMLMMVEQEGGQKLKPDYT